MKALTLINLCARDANDVAFERIKKAPAVGSNLHNWLDWLNDAQRTVVLVRPDANAITQNLTLVAGTRQRLPAGTFRLLAGNRNMGADGATPGRALRVTTHDDESAVNLNWHTEVPASPVREIIYDDKKDPLTFWVRPPGVAEWKIEAVTSSAPGTITDPDDGDVTISEVYATALQAWMMHRYYAVASQATINMQKSAGYFTEFFNLLGVQVKGEMFTGPFTVGRFPTTQAPGAPNG